MGSKPCIVAEFDREDPKTGQLVKVQRFAPAQPRRSAIDIITVNMRDECLGCVYREGFCMMALETGRDAPCMVEDEETDFSSGRMFSNNL